MVRQLSPRDLVGMLRSSDVQLLDIREPFEVEICRIEGSLHIPMSQLFNRGLELLDPNKDVVCYCHHGSRSQRIAQFLAARGFPSVFNLRGGIDAWAREVDPLVPIY